MSGKPADGVERSGPSDGPDPWCTWCHVEPPDDELPYRIKGEDDGRWPPAFCSLQCAARWGNAAQQDRIYHVEHGRGLRCDGGTPADGVEQENRDLGRRCDGGCGRFVPSDEMYCFHCCGGNSDSGDELRADGGVEQVPDAPSMGDEIAHQVYRFDGECPVCNDRFEGFKSDEEAIRSARKCYFTHDETRTPSKDEAEYVGLTGTLVCDEQLGGCGWEGDRRTAPYDALEFSKCPDCGEFGLLDGDCDE